MAAATSLITRPPHATTTTTSPLRLLTLSFTSPLITLKPKILNLQTLTLFTPHPRSSFSSYSNYLGSLENEFEQYPDDQFDSSDEEGDGCVGSAVAPVDGRKLYVGNLPFTMTANELTEILSEAGEVKSVEILYDRITDRSRGFAFVTMGRIRDAIAAIKMFNGSQIGGRTVKVNMPEVARGGKRQVQEPTTGISSQGFVDTPHKLYVGNLAWSLTSKALRDVFAKQPGFVSAKIVYAWETGQSRGYGFVSFASAVDAEAALDAVDGKEVEGRYLKVKRAIREEHAPHSPQANSSKVTIEESEYLSGISS